jgi:hypothetical protein
LKVENLVAIELSYINTKHPDFTEAGVIHKKLTEAMDGDMKKMAVSRQHDRGDSSRGGAPQYPVTAENRVIHVCNYRGVLLLRCLL